ncbi:MAG: hypothetical protein HUJ53_05755 [Holdemanella sp.]|nr:hypothetical protein [Holdemanella sp.]
MKENLCNPCIVASITTDIILYVEFLPKRQQDTKVLKTETRIGGCAYHVAKACQIAPVFAPVGKGSNAQFVKDALIQEDFECIMPTVDQDNGACYCLVEPDGERTFMAAHGAEYKYKEEWLDELEEYDLIYLSGIDMEVKENHCIIDYCKEKDKPIFLSPGPRLEFLYCMDELLDMHPILHMNRLECEILSKLPFEEGIRKLYERTKSLIIVTDGEFGSYAYDGTLYYEPSEKAVIKNTIGAGDCHAGSCLHSLVERDDIQTMLRKANDSARLKLMNK